MSADSRNDPILLKPDTDMQYVVVRGKPTTKINSIGHPTKEVSANSS